MPQLPPEAFPFCGPSYAAFSPRIDAQRSINLYPEPGLPSSKSSVALIGTPGITVFAVLGAGPVRGLWAGSSNLFGVGANGVYQIANTGAATLLGTVGGSSGACYFAQGPGPAFHLLVCDPGASKVYNIDAVTPAVTSVFDGIDIEELNGFFVSIAKPVAGTTQNQLNCSQAGNGASWPALNFAVRDSNDLLMRIAVIDNQLWTFGEQTIVPYYNTGSIGFPFAPIPGAVLNIGLLARDTLVKAKNSLLWVGAEQQGWPMVWRSQGLSAVRISNFAIENTIHTDSSNPNVFRAHIYEERGHVFYVLNFPVSSKTYAYDLTTGMWHDRAYLNGANLERARADCAVGTRNFRTGGAETYVGDYSNGNVYIQDLAYTSDNGAAIRRQRTAPHISAQNRWMKHSRLEIDADIGTAQIALAFSNDGGKTFPRSYPAQAASTDLAQDGFGRFYWLQLGRSRDRVYRATIDDAANQITLVGGYLSVNPGNES